MLTFFTLIYTKYKSVTFHTSTRSVILLSRDSTPFNVLFADKDIQATERLLRAHRGVLTKITCYIDTAVNAANILPTDKGCQELEQLKEKMEWKAEEMEAGYDRLIELDPDLSLIHI